jgi:DNA-directed RNA polymerase specialized sigma24 family protein
VNNAILTQLYTESKYKNLTRNICSKYGREYADDLHTEIIIRIIERGDNLSEVRDLFHYFFAFAHRTINEYKISKKYGYNFNRVDASNLSNENISSLTTFNYELLPSDKLYELLEPKEKDTFRDDYKKKLFKIYLEVGNYRAVAKETKIPLRNVCETLQEFKKELLKQINEHSFSHNG